MIRNILIPIFFLTTLFWCTLPSEVYQKSKQLKYEAELEPSKLIALMTEKLRIDLNNPDSLKYLKLTSKYKCYASKMGLTDNISPKFEYGYWCYNFSYNATNSYGAYVKGTDFVVYYNGKLFTPYEIDEVIRKSDDVWVYHG